MNEEKGVYHNGEEIIVKLGEYNHLLGKYFASAWYKKYPGSTAFYQHLGMLNRKRSW